MRRNLKRLLCLALAVVMSMSTLPMSAMAGYTSSDQTLSPEVGSYTSATASGVPNGTGRTFLRFTLVEFKNGIDAPNAIKNANVIRSVDILNSAEGGGHTDDNWAFGYKNLHPTNALDYYRAYTYGYGGKTGGMDAVAAYYRSSDRVYPGDKDGVSYARYTSAQFRHMLGIEHNKNLSEDDSAYLPKDMFIFSRDDWGKDFPGFGNGGGYDRLATLFGEAEAVGGVATGYEPNKLMELLWYLFWMAPSVGDVNDTSEGTKFGLVDREVVLSSNWNKTDTMGNLLRGTGVFPEGNSFYRRTSEGKSVYRIIIEPGYVASFVENAADAPTNWEQMTCRDWTACRLSDGGFSNDNSYVRFPGLMYRALFSTMETSAIYGYESMMADGSPGKVYHNKTEQPFVPAEPETLVRPIPNDNKYYVTYTRMGELLFEENKGGGMAVLTPDDFNMPPPEDEFKATLEVTKTVTDCTKAGLSDSTMAYVYPMVASIDLKNLVADYNVTKFGHDDGISSDPKAAFEVVIHETGKPDVKLDKSNVIVVPGNDKQFNIYFGLKGGQQAEIRISAMVPLGTNVSEAAAKIVYAVQEHPGTNADGSKTWIGEKVTGAAGSHPNGSLAKLGNIYQYGMATSIQATGAKEAFRVDNSSSDAGGAGFSRLALLYGSNEFNKTMELDKFYHAEQDEAGTYRNATVMGRMGTSTKVTFTNQWHTPRRLELSWNVTKDASSIINALLSSDPSLNYVKDWCWPFYFSIDATGMTRKIDRSRITAMGVTVTNKDGKWLGDGYRGYSDPADATFDPARAESFGTFVLRSGDTADATS